MLMEKKAVSLWLAPAPFYRPVHLENWDFHDESACLCVCVCVFIYACILFKSEPGAAAYPLHAWTEKLDLHVK